MMINMIISELLGHIHPVSSYNEQIDKLNKEIDDATNDPFIEIINNIRLGSAYYYAGLYDKSDQCLIKAIANIQTSDIECGENIQEEYIQIFALIGRYYNANVTRGLNQAVQILNRAKSMLSSCSSEEDFLLTAFINLLSGSLLSFNGENIKAISLLTDSIKNLKNQNGGSSNIIIASSLYIRLAIAKFRVRDYDAALNHLNQALVLSRQVNYKCGEGEALRRVGIINSAKHKINEALDALNEAYEIYEKIGYVLGKIQALSSLGRNYRTFEPKHAEYCLRKAIDIAKQHKINLELSSLYSLMGDNLMIQGRFNSAEKFYKSDYELIKQDDSIRRKAYTYRNLGRIRHIQNKLTPAISDLNKSLEYFESVDDKTNASHVALRLCQCLLEQGLFKDSRILEKKARETFGVGETFEAALCDMMLGMIYRAENKFEAACQLFQKSISTQQKFPPSFANVRTRLELALTYKDLNDNYSYINELKEIIKLSRHSRIQELEIKALELLREVDEKEWSRMRNVVFLGVSSEAQESQLIDLTVMFVDIRNYTTLTENTDVKKLAEFVNDFFEVISRIVYSRGGVINKYIGDCVMSLFGLELELFEINEDIVENAVHSAYRTAIDIYKSVKLIRHRYDFAQNVEVGIGMATGPVVAGYYGSRERMEFSVIGSTVNLASRLQNFSKMDTAIICQNTAKLLSGHEGIIDHEEVNCKGFSDPIPVKAIKFNSILNRNKNNGL